MEAIEKLRSVGPMPDFNTPNLEIPVGTTVDPTINPQTAALAKAVQIIGKQNDWQAKKMDLMAEVMINRHDEEQRTKLFYKKLFWLFLVPALSLLFVAWTTGILSHISMTIK